MPIEGPFMLVALANGFVNFMLTFIPEKSGQGLLNMRVKLETHLETL